MYTSTFQYRKIILKAISLFYFSDNFSDLFILVIDYDVLRQNKFNTKYNLSEEL